MIDLYKKVKYAGITWKVISQEAISEHSYHLSEIESCALEINTSETKETDVPCEIVDEESILTLFAETTITSTFYDVKSNVYTKSNVYKVLENIIKPKLAKRVGGNFSDITIRLLKYDEFKKLKENGINFNYQKDWWLEDANEWTSNYAACVSKNDEMFFDCVFYYNDVKPVIQIPFMALSEKQRMFLQTQAPLEDAPPEEEIVNVEIDDRIEEHEVEQEIKESLAEMFLHLQPSENIIEISDNDIQEQDNKTKPKKLKYKNKKIKLSTEDIECLQRYYETLCQDESIDEKIRNSLMDVLSQLL